MPLKVRCRECETSLNIPDAARGKTVTCPKCKTKFKVPAAEAAAPAAEKSKAETKSSKTKSKAKDDALDFGNFDLDDVEHDEDAICPYCAAELDEDDPVCRSCGMNVETGTMDRKEKKRREMKGPDPVLYYSRVWSESWAFIWQYKSLAIKTGVNFLFFSVLLAICSFMGVNYIQEQMPPKVFWLFLTTVFFLGIPGWYMALSLKVIHSDMFKEELKPDRIFIDMFQSILTGVRAVFWPVIIMMPVLIIVGPVLYFTGNTDPQTLAIAGGGMGGVAMLLFPLAQAHMAAKYSFRGWILWELLKILLKNFGPAVYWWIVTLVVFSPVLGMMAGVNLWLKDPNPFNSAVLNGITGPLANSLGEPGSGMYYMALVPMNIAIVTLVYTPICMFAGFPAVFSMKANALIAVYRGRSMDFVQQMARFNPATFWVRFLSHTIDSLLWPFAPFIVTANGKATILGLLLTGVFILTLVVPSWGTMKLPVGLAWAVYCHGMYWVVQEAANAKTTLGKDAFGLMVMTDKGKELSMQQAIIRWLVRVLAFYTFLFQPFHKQRKATHDIATNTKVVWRGDR